MQQPNFMEETGLKIDNENLQTETTTIVESNTLENSMDGNETTSLSTRMDEGDNETTVENVREEDNDAQPDEGATPTD